MITRNGLPLNFSRASRLTSIGGVANYEYDGHGRRTTQWRSDGTVRVSLYTLDGRLQGEADNRAVGSTDYLYLGSTLVARRFQHWSGSPPVVTYHHSDALGSPVAVSNAGGQLQSREWYTSYGAPTDGATEDQIGYTGHQSDPVTGLVYAQQRYYDPSVGRFISVDPIKTMPNNGELFNRYSYANNNPLKFIDPDGLASWNAFTEDEVFFEPTEHFNIEGAYTQGSHGEFVPGRGGLTQDSVTGSFQRYQVDTLKKMRATGLARGQDVYSIACRFGFGGGAVFGAVRGERE